MIAGIDNFITQLLTFSIVLFPIGIIIGVVLAVRGSKMQDTIEKKRTRSRMWLAFLGPPGLIIFLVVINGVFRLIINTFQ